MTKYERARVLGTRALQIGKNSALNNCISFELLTRLGSWVPYPKEIPAVLIVLDSNYFPLKEDFLSILLQVWNLENVLKSKYELPYSGLKHA